MKMRSKIRAEKILLLFGENACLEIDDFIKILAN